MQHQQHPPVPIYSSFQHSILCNIILVICLSMFEVMLFHHKITLMLSQNNCVPHIHCKLHYTWCLLVVRIVQYNNRGLFDDVPKAALSMSGAAAGNRPGLWWGCAWGAECGRELCNALARHYPPQRERVASGANPATDSWDAKHVWDTAHGHNKVHCLRGVHDISPDLVVGQAGRI